MKKKFLVLFFVLALSISLAACSFNGEPDASNEDNIIKFPDLGNPTNGNGEQNAASGNGENETPTENEPEPLPEEKFTIYIKAKTSVNIRSGSGASYSSLGKMDKGDMLIYKGEENGWYKTLYKEKVAFVSSGYASLFKIKNGGDNTEKTIEVGYSLLGSPYVWGSQRYHWGNGKLNSNFKNGEFDCSAFTQYIYFVGAGVKLGMTSREQSSQGQLISKNDIKRGDLLFFTNSSRKNKKGIERVGHVGIYLGENYILHTASDHAVIEEISTLRWSYFISARRHIAD